MSMESRVEKRLILAGAILGFTPFLDWSIDFFTTRNLGTTYLSSSRGCYWLVRR